MSSRILACPPEVLAEVYEYLAADEFEQLRSGRLVCRAFSEALKPIFFRTAWITLVDPATIAHAPTMNFRNLNLLDGEHSFSSSVTARLALTVTPGSSFMPPRGSRVATSPALRRRLQARHPAMLAGV